MNISFSRLGSHGRIGNSLFQIAGTLGLAEKYKANAYFPVWKYEKHFVNPLPHGEMQKRQVKEKHFNHYDWQLAGDCDIFGYLQSEKYFPKEKVFEFKPEFLQAIRDKIPVFDKSTILIQIRRGDYIGNPAYNQLPVTYYIDALLTFPHWQESNIVFISDDMSYCSIHFGCLKNAFFPAELSDIEQLALATMCDHFIISNSSFGWWAAWIGQKEHSKIIHPEKLHAGTYAQGIDEKDYYPGRWTVHKKDSFKIDLKDITFTIPVFYDHMDRKKNLDLCVCMLQSNFETNIIIGEQGGNSFEYMSEWCKYKKFELENFHRTKMLNDMAMQAETPFIANWDADVIIAPLQVYLTVLKLREGAEMVFPYDGRFARLPRVPWFKTIENALDIGIIGDTEPKGKRGKPVPEYSVGGAVFFNKESFIDGGMENEYMISFGPEDCERNDRFTKLGFRIERVCELKSGLGGPLYHIDHWCGPDSSTSNPFFKANHVEIEKIRAMSKDDLRLYVDTWNWRHKYTESYYKRIEEGAIRSAHQVYKLFPDYLNMKIIDIGCGVGEWNLGNINYTGVDYNIPLKSLMIAHCQYINCNLETDVVTGNYDLCLCLEVAEHISEGRADALIEMLCNLSDKVLFSAAIPGQGGTGHVNEQWQSWWDQKFWYHGFYPYKTDLRKALFHNENVEVWYRNNIILYTKEKFEIDYELDFVHPKMFTSCIKHYKNQVKINQLTPVL